MVLKEVGFFFSCMCGGFSFSMFFFLLLIKYIFGFLGLLIELIMLIGLVFNLLIGLVSKGLFGNLSLMELNGMVCVLVELSLVVLLGQSVNFLVGGEILIFVL